jgi:succinoglycan biosynthesis transport protein ExoP
VNDAKPISIAPYLDIVYRHRLVAVCVFALGLGTTLCLAVMLPNVYRSTAVIVVEPAQVSPDYVDVGNPPVRGQNMNVADQLDALARQAFSQARLEELIRKFGLYHVRSGQPLETKVEYMRRHIDLVVPEDAILYETAPPQQRSPDVLKISFEYSNRETAQRVTEQLANNYIDEAYRQRIKRAEDATRFLTAQVASANAEVVAKSKEVQDLQRRYQGSLPEELEPNMAEMGRLQNQLSMINQQLTSERLTPLAGGQPVPSTPEQELPALELKLTALRAEFSDEYPDVSQLKQQIADLKQQIRRNRAAGMETSSGPRPEPLDYAGSARASLERQAAMLSAQISSLNFRVAATSAHGQELEALKRDYDALDTEYHGLLKKQLGAQLREALEKRHQDQRLRLLEGADLPKKPIRPNQIAIGVFGVVFSFIAAFGLPFGLYFTDTSFKEAAELQSEYGVSVVATIPAIKVPADRRAAVIRAAFVSSAGMLAIAAAIWTFGSMVL